MRKKKGEKEGISVRKKRVSRNSSTVVSLEVQQPKTLESLITSEQSQSASSFFFSSEEESSVQHHEFVAKIFSQPTTCKYCGKLIWNVGKKQGFICTQGVVEGDGNGNGNGKGNKCGYRSHQKCLKEAQKKSFCLWMKSFSLLPAEIMLKILLHFKPRNLTDSMNVKVLVSCTHVCKSWKEIGNDQELWSNIQVGEGDIIKRLELFHRWKTGKHTSLQTIKKKNGIFTSVRTSYDKQNIIAKLMAQNLPARWIIYDVRTAKELFEWPTQALLKNSPSCKDLQDQDHRTKVVLDGYKMVVTNTKNVLVEQSKSEKLWSKTGLYFVTLVPDPIKKRLVVKTQHRLSFNKVFRCFQSQFGEDNFQRLATNYPKHIYHLSNFRLLHPFVILTETISSTTTSIILIQLRVIHFKTRKTLQTIEIYKYPLPINRSKTVSLTNDVSFGRTHSRLYIYHEISTLHNKTISVHSISKYKSSPEVQSWNRTLSASSYSPEKRPLSINIETNSIVLNDADFYYIFNLSTGDLISTIDYYYKCFRILDHHINNVSQTARILFTTSCVGDFRFFDLDFSKPMETRIIKSGSCLSSSTFVTGKLALRQYGLVSPRYTTQYGIVIVGQCNEGSKVNCGYMLPSLVGSEVKFVKVYDTCIVSWYPADRVTRLRIVSFLK